MTSGTGRFVLWRGRRTGSRSRPRTARLTDARLVRPRRRPTPRRSRRLSGGRRTGEVIRSRPDQRRHQLDLFIRQRLQRGLHRPGRHQRLNHTRHPHAESLREAADCLRLIFVRHVLQGQSRVGKPTRGRCAGGGSACADPAAAAATPPALLPPDTPAAARQDRLRALQLRRQSRRTRA